MVQTLSLLKVNKFKQIVLTQKQRFLKRSNWQYISTRRMSTQGSQLFATKGLVYFVFFARKIKYNYIKMYFKYKIQNGNMYFKYVFQIRVFEVSCRVSLTDLLSSNFRSFLYWAGCSLSTVRGRVQERPKLSRLSLEQVLVAEHVAYMLHCREYQSVHVY